MLASLGSVDTKYQFDGPRPELLETFPNPYPNRYYEVTHETDEFTSLCPVTGQPDFATITIEMVPKDKCVESKSLKLYLFSYRNCGAFMEKIVNDVLTHLVTVCSPRRCLVSGTFKVRGGIKTTVEVEYEK